ncbi:glycosyltransferase family 2 protein [Dolichospermum circinale CS-1225]|uniref:glycosyltransferase family 2 protein n=1 Tax=Dolichospermum circinale TaxID=109265 RepID=UPI0004239AF6|nr:glycosyltransferase family 2 protein [Dolichospermum circinale]MDB9521110.1 glycosyltransferase family 2 protein [Dolichospermum circinale CS-1225]
MSLAPIAFFAYKRPEHTKQSLESLAQNEGAESSELFIFCDAAKKPEDEASVTQVREVVRSKQWCGKVHIIEREQNLGLANSIIQGVTELCSKYGKVIVLEDDLILSPFFLNYMNTALNQYEDTPEVMQISGYMFPVELKHTKADAIFLPFTTSWGWATWQRAWNHFDPLMSGYIELKNNRKLRNKFNLNNSYPYFEMLENQLNRKIDSWAIRWYLSTFVLNGITLYPTHSLVKNIGFDGSGVHCGVNTVFETIISQQNIFSFPEKNKISMNKSQIVFKYLKVKTKQNLFTSFTGSRSSFYIISILFKKAKYKLYKFIKNIIDFGHEYR